MLLKNELQTGSERKCKRINEVKGDLNNVGMEIGTWMYYFCYRRTLVFTVVYAIYC